MRLSGVLGGLSAFAFCLNSPLASASIIVESLHGPSPVQPNPPPRPPTRPKPMNKIEVLTSEGKSLPNAAKLQSTNQVVMICFTHDPMIKKQCDTMKKRFDRCGITPVVLENKSIADIRKGIKGLPPNTNVFIAGHGINWSPQAPEVVAASLLGLGATPLGPVSIAERAKNHTNDQHYIGVPAPLGANLGAKWGVRFKINTDEINIETNVLNSDDLFRAIDEEIGRDGIVPSKIFGACFGGNVLSRNSFSNAMTMVQWDQEALGWKNNGWLTDLEAEATRLLCDEQKFRQLDSSRQGYLTGKVLAAHLSKKRLPRLHEENPETPILKDFILYPVVPSLGGPSQPRVRGH